MNIDKLLKRNLSELTELKSATQSLCEDYAKNLTNYATMSNDPMFQKMDYGTQDVYRKRGELVSLLNEINKAIEVKLYEIYNEK